MDYIKEAKRTDINNYDIVYSRLQDMWEDNELEILHATLGLVTEAGEITDAIKKHLMYGRSLDKVNLIEEAGDIMWYLAILCKNLGVSFEEVQARNIAKLKARYPEKFTEEAALNRDLGKERKELEK